VDKRCAVAACRSTRGYLRWKIWLDKNDRDRREDSPLPSPSYSTQIPLAGARLNTVGVNGGEIRDRFPAAIIQREAVIERGDAARIRGKSKTAKRKIASATSS